MIAIFGMIPVILVGIIFLVINPLWSALWMLLAVGTVAFAFTRKKRARAES